MRSSVALILRVGALAIALATAISALLIAILSAVNPLYRETTSPSVLEILESAALLCPITAVSAGSFGLLAGISGGAVLRLRKQRIRSTKRLLLEASIIGCLLSFLFPFFDRLLNPTSVNSMYLIMSIPIGVICAVLCAFTFRHRFLREIDGHERSSMVPTLPQFPR